MKMNKKWRTVPSGSARRGFTLIELLVVIAIIALLAAILFPVFAKAREKARQTACLSNEKQIGLGIIQYLDDYDEKYPNGCTTTGGAPDNQGIGWAGQVYSFVKSTAVLHCPDDTSPQINKADTLVSYAYNLAIPRTDVATAIGGAVSQLNNTAKTVMLCEVDSIPARPDNAAANNGQDASAATFSSGPAYSAATEGIGLYPFPGGGPGGSFDTGYMGRRGKSNPYTFPRALGWHSDGSNFLFADGHAKWLRGDAVSSGNPAAKQTDDESFTGFQPAAGTANPKWTATFSPV